MFSLFSLCLSCLLDQSSVQSRVHVQTVYLSFVWSEVVYIQTTHTCQEYMIRDDLLLLSVSYVIFIIPYSVAICVPYNATDDSSSVAFMAQVTPSAWRTSADSSQAVNPKTGRRAARAHVGDSVLRRWGVEGASSSATT